MVSAYGPHLLRVVLDVAGRREKPVVLPASAEPPSIPGSTLPATPPLALTLQ